MSMQTTSVVFRILSAVVQSFDFSPLRSTSDVDVKSCALKRDCFETFASCLVARSRMDHDIYERGMYSMPVHGVF